MLRKPSSRPARVKDVAALAEVSVTTVSRYLNAGLVLPPATAERIDAAVRQLAYQPNRLARSLSLGRSDTIGLVVPEIANPFFAHLAAAVEEAAEAAGLGLLLCATLNRLDRELDYLERLRSHQVDGLIFLTNHHDDGRLAEGIRASRNLVLIDEDVAGTSVPKLFCDNLQGGRLAGERLLAAGHRRLGFVGGPVGLMSTDERLDGLRAAAGAVAGAAVAWACSGPHTPEQGRAAAAAWLALRDRPTGLLLGSGVLLDGFLEAVREAGIAVPDALSLVAFDDVGPLHLFNPPVTAIRQPVAELGRQGVALLRGRLRGEPAGPPLRLPVELVERHSVASPPARPTRKAIHP
ncbi:LacI family DNA-binding transcriptional regulator [Roseomonas sp. M0104]|uniref:LacI family DNA-binding transcriptional regulator n=1 Tax=Teichococcus coralli TaxID=2545983 RepID=A0A845BDK5_9PROT|nr:LacI family DNA-binding transcriptional regulator [Pseudoroseomonas coralli]MXP64995.1 LacI family DNA-binding transcriptional regulator [Pseudoroseomonas coralli]